MKKIIKINGLWAVIDGQEIIECFDTKYQADEYFEPERQRQALIQFDQTRSWTSLWDEERENEQA